MNHVGQAGSGRLSGAGLACGDWVDVEGVGIGEGWLIWSSEGSTVLLGRGERSKEAWVKGWSKLSIPELSVTILTTAVPCSLESSGVALLVCTIDWGGLSPSLSGRGTFFDCTEGSAFSLSEGGMMGESRGQGPWVRDWSQLMSMELSVSASFANCLAVVRIVSRRGTFSSPSLVSTSKDISLNSASSSSSSSLDSLASDSSVFAWRFPFFCCRFLCFFDFWLPSCSCVRFLLLFPFVKAVDAEGFAKGADWWEGASFVKAVEAEMFAEGVSTIIEDEGSSSTIIDIDFSLSNEGCLSLLIKARARRSSGASSYNFSRCLTVCCINKFRWSFLWSCLSVFLCAQRGVIP